MEAASLEAYRFVDGFQEWLEFFPVLAVGIGAAEAGDLRADPTLLSEQIDVLHDELLGDRGTTGMAMRVAREIIDHGKARRTVIGAEVSTSGATGKRKRSKR